MHRGKQLRRLLLRTGSIGGSYVALASSSNPHTRPILPRSSTAAACDAAAAPPAPRGYSTSSSGRKKRGRGGPVAAGDDSTAAAAAAAVPAKIDLTKALDDMKQASEAVGGPFKGDEALALMALLARELVVEQTGAGGDRASPRLKSTLVSPPLSALRTRERAKRFLEYATLCENVYNLPLDKDWQAPPAALGPVDGWKLLASHPGGVCIPRYVVLRIDGGAGVKGRRRTKRLLVVVRGTADVTDAAINIAMCPGSFTHQGQEHQCHKGIVEAAAFLERMVRPVIWRELDALKAEGVDPGHAVEVIFTGHSLGGATAAIAALELQGEFGPRVPVRCVGFSTPASLSESIACAPATRRICTTVVLGDDIVPRCSTKNLQHLKRKAQSVTVDAEIGSITAMVKQDLARRGDEWSKQLAQMLKTKASEAQRAVAPKLPALMPALPALRLPPGPVDVAGLKAALGGVLAGYVLPRKGQQPGAAEKEEVVKEVATAAVVEEALHEYEEALDAELQYVTEQLERLRRGALQSLAPVLPEALQQQQQQQEAPTPQRRASSGASDEEEEEEEDEEKEEAALLAANAAAATCKASDLEAVQTALQQLLGEKASMVASSVKAEAEARVRALLSETNKGVEEVRGKAAATVSWMKDSVRGLQEQARAVLPPSSPPAPPQPSTGPSPPDVCGEQPEQRAGAEADVGFDDDDASVALYPPGEVFWIKAPSPVAAAAVAAAAVDASGGGAGAAAAAARELRYELRRVRDVRFFDGIVLSPSMFTHHLLGSVIGAIRALMEDDAKSRGT